MTITSPFTRSYKRTGFTLLEMSIVIVIIALIIAGIMVGRSMVENAAMQSVVSDFELYRQAALSYRDKYKQLPGDHTDATSLTSADGGCPNPSASNAAFIATCNGNGDGIIGDGTGNPLTTISAYNETLLAWQHLGIEGLIPGKYNGRRSSASSQITLNVNVPESKVEGASFNLRFFPTNTFTTGFFKTTYNHVMFFGRPGASAAAPFTSAALTTTQAKSVDLKIDDGMPGMGKVLTLPGGATSCANGIVETTALYNSGAPGTICSLIFITEF